MQWHDTDDALLIDAAIIEEIAEDDRSAGAKCPFGRPFNPPIRHEHEPVAPAYARTAKPSTHDIVQAIVWIMIAMRISNAKYRSDSYPSPSESSL
jgi:hypothetical protein